jgi:hypothetical protein
MPIIKRRPPPEDPRPADARPAFAFVSSGPRDEADGARVGRVRLVRGPSGVLVGIIEPPEQTESTRRNAPKLRGQNP